jgi:hypothetical protein
MESLRILPRFSHEPRYGNQTLVGSLVLLNVGDSTSRQSLSVDPPWLCWDAGWGLRRIFLGHVAAR